MCTLILCVILLGQPEIVSGPGWFPDGAVFTTGGALYTTNVITFRNNDPVLWPDNEWDSCGAWLLSAYQDGAVLRGWYHAETNCDYQNGLNNTRKSIAYVESYDNGLTWVKPDYPNNQIISHPTLNQGDFRVVRHDDDYYWLYYLNNDPNQPAPGIHLARATIASGGTPGTWYKWHNGTFDEPGLGGTSDPIAPIDQLSTGWVVWNDHLNCWLGFYNTNTGRGVSVSQDGLTWQAMGVDVLASGNEWLFDRSQSTQNLIAYLSTISPDDNSDIVGQEFYIYYMEIAPGQGWNQRYLMRQKVSVEWPKGVWLPLAIAEEEIEAQ